jgi:hypothetical protein
VGFTLFGRICVGAPLEVRAAAALHRDFIASLELPDTASPEDVFAALLDQAPKHKRHEPDRVRYERALEAFIDARHAVDFALGGLTPEGLFDPQKNYLFVGVCIESFVTRVPVVGRGASAPERPQWISWGELGSNSTLGKSFDLDRDGEKAWDHARRSYQRANKDITRDALARIKPLPLSKQHDPGWALCRWLIPDGQPCIEPR